MGNWWIYYTILTCGWKEKINKKGLSGSALIILLLIGGVLFFVFVNDKAEDLFVTNPQTKIDCQNSGGSFTGQFDGPGWCDCQSGKYTNDWTCIPLTQEIKNLCTSLSNNDWSCSHKTDRLCECISSYTKSISYEGLVECNYETPDQKTVICDQTK